MTDLPAEVAELGLHSVRVTFADQHGSLRGKTIGVASLGEALESGVGIPSSLLHKDAGGTYALGLWEEVGDSTLDQFVGVQNMVIRPDPATFRVLPWLDGTGLLLGDIETLAGDPIGHSARRLCRQALQRLSTHGYEFRAGLELEFHIYLSDPCSGEPVQHSHPGWDLLGEDGLDRIEPALAPIRDGLTALGFPPRSIEVELGPSQVEITFDPADGLDVADQAVLVRSAIRQIARRHGHFATFMSRPAPGGVEAFPSGWHLHQSLVSGADGTNVLRPQSAGGYLSDVGGRYVAGLLAHAAPSCLLTTPTVNGYKRYRPRAITPDRVTWSRENRGALLRIIGGADDPATRIENRAGDPAANPYLYVASQVISGLDGIEQDRPPPPPTDSPYEVDAGELLPRSLGDAIDEFESSHLYHSVWGEEVVNYLLALKRSEWNRFLAAVTDWEQREYFGRF